MPDDKDRESKDNLLNPPKKEGVMRICFGNCTSFNVHREHIVSINADVIGLSETKLGREAAARAKGYCSMRGWQSGWGKPRELRVTKHFKSGNPNDAVQGGVGILVIFFCFKTTPSFTELEIELLETGRYVHGVMRVSSNFIIHIFTIYGFSGASSDNAKWEERYLFLSLCPCLQL